MDDLRKGNISQRRNPLIADLFRRIEMVEAWGCGMPLIIKNAPDVVFREVGRLFIVSFNRPSFSTELTGEEDHQSKPTALDRTTQEKLFIGEKVGEKVGEKLTLNQEAIVREIIKDPRISARALAAIVGISSRKVEENIKKLKEQGRLIRIGPAKGGHWKVVG